MATPRAQWPLPIKAIALFSIPEDRGIGDVVARVIGPIGGDQFKAWTKLAGFDCGCGQRQADWNAKYPLNTAIETPLQDP